MEDDIQHEGIAEMSEAANDLFSVWVPFHVLEKARSRPNAEKPEQMVGRIGGIISSEHKDFQGETILQKGLDWSYFLKHGWFNYEHMQGPENVLGHPERVALTTSNGKPATAVQGVLYLHKPQAKRVFETAVAIQKAKAPRRLGFSIEGKTKERLGKNVLKAQVLNVAITAHPINPDGRLEILAKALNGYNPSYGGSIGHQYPAQPAAGAPLSALVPQSLAETPSIATYARYAMDQKRLSVPDLAALLTNNFPNLSHGEAIRIAREMARVVG